MLFGDKRLPERFWEKVAVEFDDRGCWLWTGCKSGGGYCQTSYSGGYKYVHRIAYEVLVGKIDSGMQLDHLCRVRNCVNPKHLEQVDQKTNINRGMSPSAILSRNGLCKYGHKLTDYITGKTVGKKRYCRTCKGLL